MRPPPSIRRPGRWRCAAFLQNADRALLPGYFVRVRVPRAPADGGRCWFRTWRSAADQAGRYVLVVGKRQRGRAARVQGRPARRRHARHREWRHAGRQGHRVGTAARRSRARRSTRNDDADVSRRRRSSAAMFSNFFIERPVLANVIAILMVVIGAVALLRLPVAQYPNVVPPTVSGDDALSRRQRPHRHRHRGAADRAAGQRHRGHALHAVLRRRRRHLCAHRYIQDRHRPELRAGPGAEPRRRPRPHRCRSRCRRRASSSRRSRPPSCSSSRFTSPDNRYDSLYMSNYATIRLKDEIARLPGVGNDGRVRRRPVRHAHLARSGAAAGARAERAGRHPGAAAAERAGGRRPDRHAAGAPTTPPSSTRSTSRAASTTRTQFANVIVKTGVGGEITRVQRRRPRRARRPDLQPDFQAQRQSVGRHRHLSVARRQRPRLGRGRRRQDEAARAQISRRGWPTPSRSTRRCSSGSRSTRSTRR